MDLEKSLSYPPWECRLQLNLFCLTIPHCYLHRAQDVVIREEGAAGREGCSCSLIAGLLFESSGWRVPREGMILRICGECSLSSSGGRILEAWGLLRV